MNDLTQENEPSGAIRRYLSLALLTVLTALLLAAALLAANALVARADRQGAEPLPPGVALYFTQNLTRTAPTQDVTPMEQALLDALNGATSTIDAAIYDFDRASVRDALLAAHARGVSVRIVGDDDARGSEKSRATFDTLQAAGIPMVFDGPVLAAQSRTLDAPYMQLFAEGADPAAIDEMATSRIMHDKYFIIDGARLWTGSVNMSDTDMTLNHNHALLFDNPQVVAIYQGDFNQMLAGAFGNKKTPTVTNTVDIGAMQLTIAFAAQDDPIQSVIREIDNAHASIDFAIFFFTHDGVRDALLRAYNRGVRIRGLWDNLGSRDGSSDNAALCDAGVSIKIENTRGIMHHKLMVIDAQGSDPRVIAGSLNWTVSGTQYNNENTLVLRHSAVTNAFAAVFQEMWDGIDVTPCNPEQQGVLYRFWLPLINGVSGDAPPPPPTVTPQPSATPIAPVGAIEIVKVVYDPPGLDLDNEQVVIANRHSAPVPLAGWTLRDDATNANIFTFPVFTLGVGAQVTVWVKAGTNDAQNLYWGRGSPVWNNDGDVATLRDATGVQWDACAWLGGGDEALCD